jgi:hypothetical protein
VSPFGWRRPGRRPQSGHQPLHVLSPLSCPKVRPRRPQGRPRKQHLLAPQVLPLCARCHRALAEAGAEGRKVKATGERWWPRHGVERLESPGEPSPARRHPPDPHAQSRRADSRNAALMQFLRGAMPSCPPPPLGSERPKKNPSAREVQEAKGSDSYPIPFTQRR